MISSNFRFLAKTSRFVLRIAADSADEAVAVIWKASDFLARPSSLTCSIQELLLLLPLSQPRSLFGSGVPTAIFTGLGALKTEGANFSANKRCGPSLSSTALKDLTVCHTDITHDVGDLLFMEGSRCLRLAPCHHSAHRSWGPAGKASRVLPHPSIARQQARWLSHGVAENPHTHSSAQPRAACAPSNQARPGGRRPAACAACRQACWDRA